RYPRAIGSSRRSRRVTPGGPQSFRPADLPSEKLTAETVGEVSDARLLGAALPPATCRQEADRKAPLPIRRQQRDRFRNKQQPLSLGCGNWSSCPDLAVGPGAG